MQKWTKVLGVLVMLLLVSGVSQSLAATKVSGKASAEFEWFDDANEETATPGYLYLLFNATDIGSSGWNFRSYGRLAEDLSDTIDVKSRLYYAYLEKRNLVKGLDLRLGRQFISTTAGASLMDGLDLRLGKLGPLELELFGGGDVNYYDGYSSSDLIWGVELGSRELLENFSAGLSYLQKWEDDELSHELIGLDLDYDLPLLAHLYSETQYSWITEEVTYFVLGGNYFRSANWSLTAEYLYSLPVFSSTSIYSVFAVDEYQQGMLEFTYRIKDGLKAFGRYTHEFYESVDDADVVEVGIEKLPTGRLSGYLIGTYRLDQDGQDLKGIKARLAYQCMSGFTAGVGAHLDVLERQIGFLDDQYDDQDETTSQRYWIDGSYQLTKAITMQAKLEAVKSNLWDNYYRGRVRLTYAF